MRQKPRMLEVSYSIDDGHGRGYVVCLYVGCSCCSSIAILGLQQFFLYVIADELCSRDSNKIMSSHSLIDQL